MKQRGISSTEFGLFMLLIALMFGAAWSSFLSRKAECDRRYATDKDLAFQCLHNQQRDQN